ncbi:hypothetical protein [Sedimenticola selenatireducens]|uniref:hypothetical protein n=1 Tax=Sedimenticola selenatireducens TaxID=191960 RepID=UPI000491BD45|nr:hypothetical protein [Sedimenticola selenatireducens]
MKKSILVALMALSATFANHGYTAEEHSHGHDSHGSVATQTGLSLNNGERWEMDDHTRTMSQMMQQTFFAADHSTLGGLNAAGTALEQQMEKLITGCTMTGKAHEQLHVFLNEHVPTINALAKADDYASARENAIRLKGQMETYQKHFK